MNVLAVAVFMCVYSDCVTTPHGENKHHDNDKATITESTSSPCENFYKHVCPHPKKKSHGTKPGFLKQELYKKIKDILGDITWNNIHQVDIGVNKKRTIRTMTKTLYKICLEDKDLSSKVEVMNQLVTILRQFGVEEWPYDSPPSDVQYWELLQKSGLRPFATIATIRDPEESKYILAMNAPLPRFGVYPGTMRKIRKRTKIYKAYKNFICSVLMLFYKVGSAQSGTKTSCYEEATDPTSSEEDESEEELDLEDAINFTRNEDQEDELERIINDIVEVETNLAHMIYYAKFVDVFQTDTAQGLEKRIGGQFPLLEGLRRDVKRAKDTLANNHKIGIHLLDYFEKLRVYLESLNVRKLANYIGWFVVREVADVLTLDIRKSLNLFLKEIPKPRVAETLVEDACIEKLIGYHGMMEKAVSHLYLSRYFGKLAIKEVSSVADHINSTFFKIIERNSWMDEETRVKSKEWITYLQYHMGAPSDLLDGEYVRNQYDLVELPEVESLLLYTFAYRDNNFLQVLRLRGQPYDRSKIWPASSLATYGRYSELYTSLEIPAGALQYPIYYFYEHGYAVFGSMGTYAAEVLTDAFTDEGRVWQKRVGRYNWTDETIKKFQNHLKCLKKGRGAKSNKEEVTSQEKFDSDGHLDTLILKLHDHVGLRTSYNAYRNFISQCAKGYEQFRGHSAVELLRKFFESYALRHCGLDATAEDDIGLTSH